MTDLAEQVQIEYLPGIKEEGGQAEIEKWSPLRTFEHFAKLYIKYVEIMRKLEECYDQIVQPQKRVLLKKILESTIIRVLELKETLIFFNPRLKSPYVNLDEILMFQKLQPDCLEIPIPRYFAEEDRTQLERRKQLLDKLLIANFGSDEPEEDEQEEMYFLEINIDTALRIIQKDERGRQGRERTIKARNLWRKKKLEEDRKAKMAKREEVVEENVEVSSSLTIQRVFRAFVSRVYTENLREKELVFLGMASKPTPSDDPIRRMDLIKEQRRLKRVEYSNEYENAVEELKTVVLENERPDIEEKLKDERRNWAVEWISRRNFKEVPPIAKFYEAHDEDKLLTSEEEAKKKLDSDEASKKAKEDKNKKKGKKEGGKKGKKDKKGKKKKKAAEDDTQASKWIGPSPQVQCLQGESQTFKNVWENRDESTNPAQKYDVELVKQEVRPGIMEIVRLNVDEILEAELENIKVTLGGKRNKPAKGRKGKTGKKAGKKGKNSKKGGKGKKKGKVPGAKLVGNRAPEDLFAELVQKGVLRKLVPASISDFKGSFNYLGSIMQHNLTLADKEPAASYAQIRQLITEFAILPLGSSTLKMNAPSNINSILLYGPPGSGKTLLARAIASHTCSLFIDISPYTMGQHYANENKGLNKALYCAFTVAVEFGPAVIYMDECEKYFAGGGGGKKKSKKKGKGPFSRLKKDLVAHKKFLEKQNRVIIIGCTSKPWDASKVDLKSFFNHKLYIPKPNYMTRKELWEHFLEKEGALPAPKLNISTLAQISDGYTAGSIQKAIKKVLTEQRKNNLRWRPLAIPEFISPLSRTYCVAQQEYDELTNLTYELIGMKARFDAEKKAKEEAEAEQSKDKKKGGKKK